MRGKVIKTKSVIFSTGITPAYAGKREIENVSAPLFAGSPPPMRGKVRNGTAKGAM